MNWSRPVSCVAGSVDMANRTGSHTASGYGSGYETVTDGSTYIATTLDTQGAVAGRTHQESTVNSGVSAALQGMTDQSSAVGYYDQTAGGVVIPALNDEVVSVRFASSPVQGQPVIYSTISTTSPPVQLASIAGGGYSLFVPIPPTVTPSPTSPTAVVSPPASASTPEAVSLIYTPPATVVVNPVSPWAPSPVPPPPPPSVATLWPSSGLYWQALYRYQPGDGYDPMPYYTVTLYAPRPDGSQFSVSFQCRVSNDGSQFGAGSWDGNSTPAGSQAQCAAVSDAIFALAGLGAPFYPANWNDKSGIVMGYAWASLTQSNGQGGNPFYPIGLYGTSDYGGHFGRPSSSYIYGGQTVSPRNDTPTGSQAERIINDYQTIAGGGLG